jgi:hypothetical protein
MHLESSLNESIKLNYHPPPIDIMNIYKLLDTEKEGSLEK